MSEAARIVADNVARVRERIAAAAAAAGRPPESVWLIAVSKYVDAAAARLLVEAGCNDLAESRPQQLWEKAAAAELAGVRWHLVGRLQRNKVRRTLPLVELIHSVHSERLLAEIDHEAALAGLMAQVLLEVNCSGDAAKQGFAADEARRLVDGLAQYSHVEVCGLMTMAALEGGPAVARRNFAALRELRDELSDAAGPGIALAELSMGMSDDFEEAIAEGATMVRIGSLLLEGLPR